MGRPNKPWYWKARKTWCINRDGKRIVLGPNRKMAMQLFHKLMAEPERKVLPDSALVVIDKFLDWVQENRAPKTYTWYRDFLSSFGRTIKHLRLDQVKPHHVQDWLKANPQWKGGKRGAVAAAKRAFNWAAQQGYIEHNPLRYVEKPAANIRQEVVSDSEHKTILALIPDPQFRDVVEFARNTGVRPMEVTRLEERHLELKRKRIVFPEAESKGKKKKRVIYLNREALEIVKRNRRDGHIFRNTRGKPWTAFAMNCRFEKMKTKLGKRYNMYMYRHTFATRKLQQGVDPITVAILLGHADVSTLAKVYQHLQNDAAHLLKAANV